MFVGIVFVGQVQWPALTAAGSAYCKHRNEHRYNAKTHGSIAHHSFRRNAIGRRRARHHGLDIKTGSESSMGDQGHHATFADRIEALLSAIEATIDRLSDEIDIDALRAGNVLTLTFENAHRIIINSQEAAQEVWVAARSGGFHFRLDDATKRWIDTRSGDDLRVLLARLIEIETGIAPTLAL